MIGRNVVSYWSNQQVHAMRVIKLYEFHGEKDFGVVYEMQNCTGQGVKEITDSRQRAPTIAKTNKNLQHKMRSNL